jgi:hypothetical protein
MKQDLPLDARIGHPLKSWELLENAMGYFFLVGVFLFAALTNHQEYIKEQYFLFGFLFGLNICHLVICGIMAHATHETFTYWNNMIFIGNFLMMFFNTLTFHIVGDRIPSYEFLVGMIVLTGVCQVYLYLRWIMDITLILGIRVFFVKPVTAQGEAETRDQPDIESEEGSLNP